MPMTLAGRLLTAFLAILASPHAASQSVVVRDGNGVAIGFYAGSAARSDELPAMRVVSSTGYVALFDSVTGEMLRFGYDLDGRSSLGVSTGVSLSGPLFESNDCTGLGVLQATGPALLPTAGGFVFPAYLKASGDRVFVYVRKGAGTHSISTVGSYVNASGTNQCQPIIPPVPGPISGLPAGLPTPEVTGFTGDAVGPLTLGIVEPSRPDFLFDDSFEAA